MSPDRGAEQVVSGAIASAIRRARLLALAEAAAWGAAARRRSHRSPVRWIARPSPRGAGAPVSARRSCARSSTRIRIRATCSSPPTSWRATCWRRNRRSARACSPTPPARAADRSAGRVPDRAARSRRAAGRAGLGGGRDVASLAWPVVARRLEHPVTGAVAGRRAGRDAAAGERRDPAAGRTPASKRRRPSIRSSCRRSKAARSCSRSTRRRRTSASSTTAARARSREAPTAGSPADCR